LHVCVYVRSRIYVRVYIYASICAYGYVIHECEGLRKGEELGQIESEKE